MSKLGLDIGENRCVIKFNTNYPSSATFDTGTITTPVWWCTKDSSNWFNVPEQFYLVYAWQNTNYPYIDPKSVLSVYNSSQFTGGGSVYTITYNSNTTTSATMRQAIWICDMRKFKPSLTIQSGGINSAYYVAVIPL